MARKPIHKGNRAAPGAAQNTAPVDPTITVGKTPVLFPAGTYDVTVIGARSIPHKSGARSMEVVLKEEDTGDCMDTDRMLVYSPGGASRQTDRSVAILTDLCDFQEGARVTLSDIEAKLNEGSIKAEVDIYVSTDLDGRPCNKLAAVNAIITDEE